MGSGEGAREGERDRKKGEGGRERRGETETHACTEKQRFRESKPICLNLGHLNASPPN